MLWIDFSKQPDIPEIDTPLEMKLRGDVNEDDVVDVSDAVLLARFCAEDSKAVVTAQGKINAAVIDDGKIDAADVTGILKIIAKLPLT